MTTMTMPRGVAKIVFPTRREMRLLMYTPGVFITIIICVTIFAILTLAGVVFLAYTGHDAAVVGTLITGALVGVGGLMNARIKRTLEAVKEQKEGSDGS